MEQLSLLAPLEAAKKLADSRLISKGDVQRVSRILYELQGHGINPNLLVGHIAKGNFHQKTILSAPIVKPRLKEKNGDNVRQSVESLSRTMFKHHHATISRFHDFGSHEDQQNYFHLKTYVGWAVGRKANGVRKTLPRSQVAIKIERLADTSFSQLLFLLGLPLHRVLAEHSKIIDGIKPRGIIGNEKMNFALMQLVKDNKANMAPSYGGRNWLARVERGLRRQSI